MLFSITISYLHIEEASVLGCKNLFQFILHWVCSNSFCH